MAKWTPAADGRDDAAVPVHLAPLEGTLCLVPAAIIGVLPPADPVCQAGVLSTEGLLRRLAQELGGVLVVRARLCTWRQPIDLMLCLPHLNRPLLIIANSLQ